MLKTLLMLWAGQPALNLTPLATSVSMPFINITQGTARRQRVAMGDNKQKENAAVEFSAHKHSDARGSKLGLAFPQV